MTSEPTPTTVATITAAPAASRLLLMPPDAVRARMAATVAGGGRADRLAERLQGGGGGGADKPAARSLRAELGLYDQPAVERIGAVSVVRLSAATDIQPGLYEEILGESVATGQVVAQLREAKGDPATHTVVLAVNSPGGTVAGQSDLLAAVAEVRAAGKRVVALANDQATSAAQWLMSAADFALATPTAMVGSVGAIVALVDASVLWNRLGLRSVVVASGPAKGVGAPGQPITEADVAEVGRLIAQLGGMFVADVAGRRKMSAAQRAEVASARVYTAAEGLRHGLLDGIVPGGLAELVARLQDRNANPIPTGGAGTRGGANPAARAARSTVMDLQTLKAEHPDTFNAARAAALADFGGEETVRAALAAGKPATVAELEAAFPNSPAFVLGQLKAGATIDRAKIAHAEQLGLELKACRDELAKAQARVAELEAAAATRPLGAKPVGVKPTGGAGGGGGGDVIAEVEARVEALKAEKNLTTNAAHAAVKNENRRRYDEYVQAKRDEARPARR